MSGVKSLEVDWIPQLVGCMISVLNWRLEIFLFGGFCLQNGVVGSLLMCVFGFDRVLTGSFCPHVSILSTDR